MLTKVISGGQTGADRAGLDAARDFGLETGGTAPKGWRICNPDGSDGSDPTLADLGLLEHWSREYPLRTKQNVADSDGTVWFGHQDSPSGKLTIGTAQKLRKPWLINPSSGELRDWLERVQVRVLNVAGNRVSSFNRGIYQRTYDTLIETFKIA